MEVCVRVVGERRNDSLTIKFWGELEIRRENNYNEEIWSIITDYPNYEVSSLGRVMNVKTGRILKSNLNMPNGYLCVRLSNDEGIKLLLVHRLVAKAFILNPDNLKTVDHIDSNKLNNKADNLQWMTQADNVRKARNKPVNQYYKNGDYIATYASAVEASRQTGIKYNIISACCRGQFIKGAEYIWQYI